MDVINAVSEDMQNKGSFPSTVCAPSLVKEKKNHQKTSQT